MNFISRLSHAFRGHVMHRVPYYRGRKVVRCSCGQVWSR